jgi:apolipoprotein N-acyltransferase
MFLLQAFIAFLSGAALSAAFPPVGLWFLALALMLLFVLTARADSARDAFGFGFWFGVGFFALHIFWLPNSLSEIFGSVAWLMYPPIVLAEGVFWGLVTGLSRWLAGRYRASLWLLPAFWLLMEWARTQGSLAFPWGSLGYIWVGTPIAQLADIAGSYGLSLVTLCIAALLAVPFVPAEEPAFLYTNTFVSPLKTFMPIVLGLFLLLGSFAYSFYKLGQPQITPDQKALLVQGNTDPLGRVAGITPDFDVYTQLTQTALENLSEKPSLVIWPEGAIYDRYITGMQGEEARKAIQASAHNNAVITGAGIWEDSQTRYNAAVSIVNGTISSQYNKLNLVPFGEAAPFSRSLNGLYTVVYGWFGLLPSVTTPGLSYTPLIANNIVAATYICYESVFPQVARSMVAQGANVLVNISNDAWFGKGNGAEQHYLMGSLRAIETRRYILRAGNDGITAVITPQGKTLERIDRSIASSLLADFALSDAITPYVRYGHLLIWAVMIYAVVTGTLLALRRS